MHSATLQELAARFGCGLRGRGDAIVTHVATLGSATGDAVTFLANPLYRDQLAGTRAGAVILQESFAAACPVACLVTENPYATYARIAAYLHPPRTAEPGIHPTASVAPSASVPKSAHVGAGAAIGADSILGANVVIGAGAIVGRNVRIGKDTQIAPRVSLLDDVTLGERCIVHSGAVVGADGFGFAEDRGEWVKIPHLGTVVIGNDVEIGANTTIDRGTIEATVIEDGVKLDNLVQIAHNVRIGAHTVMAAMSGAAGSTRIGRRCKFGGGAVVANQLTICDDVTLLFRSSVTKSITEPGVYGGCLPAEEASRWRRTAARVRNLDTMAERLQALERSAGSRQAAPGHSARKEKPRPAKLAKPLKRRSANKKRKRRADS
jgi:UDP-3-O-[3-hydroxymyristoyl] glucosamine N-acyltransferase